MEKITNPLKIEFPIGVLKLNHYKPFLAKGECHKCKKIIFWAKIGKGNKTPISKINNEEYAIHSLVCPSDLARKKQAERKERSKQYKNKKNHADTRQPTINQLPLSQ